MSDAARDFTFVENDITGKIQKTMSWDITTILNVQIVLNSESFSFFNVF